ncbi:hypothetical protein ARMSODRAFT_356471 [Armillaria solidipes]|uniref:Uncharacterized protein n=1 Tax=Armillaria solidipes TaxID=1076256 RepID=A0A2H3B5Y4_9AGAR|nr:hypothetical protein ARMSODRAFT_356471 [Armillaria solidipes]
MSAASRVLEYRRQTRTCFWDTAVWDGVARQLTEALGEVNSLDEVSLYSLREVCSVEAVGRGFGMEVKEPCAVNLTSATTFSFPKWSGTNSQTCECHTWRGTPHCLQKREWEPEGAERKEVGKKTGARKKECSPVVIFKHSDAYSESHEYQLQLCATLLTGTYNIKQYSGKERPDKCFTFLSFHSIPSATKIGYRVVTKPL